MEPACNERAASSVDRQAGGGTALPRSSRSGSRHTYRRSALDDDLVMALVLKPCFDNIEPVGEASQIVPAHVEIRRSRRRLGAAAREPQPRRRHGEALMPVLHSRRCPTTPFHRAGARQLFFIGVNEVVCA